MRLRHFRLGMQGWHSPRGLPVPRTLHVQAVVAFPSFFFRQIPVIAIIVIPSISTFPRAESTVIVAKTEVLPESGCRMKLSGYFES
jgi:hypothetical protein